MKFFIDTANIEEIKKAHALGMVDGVTTNPSLIAKENRPFEELLREICELVDGPVNGEAVSLDAEGMVDLDLFLHPGVDGRQGRCLLCESVCGTSG
jgi:transaldolase